MLHIAKVVLGQGANFWLLKLRFAMQQRRISVRHLEGAVTK
jgi:hypothetical protein